MTLPSPDLFSARHARVREAVQRERLDALVLVHLPNVRYLTGFAGSAAAVVVTPSRLVLITDSRYVTVVERDLMPNCPGLELAQVEPTYDQTICAVLGGMKATRTGIESAYLPVGRYSWLRAALSAASGTEGPGVELVETSRLVEAERLTKDTFEQATLRRAGAMISTVAGDIVSELRAGLSESQIAADIDWAIKTAGFEGPSFDTIVASGPNGALPHARPGGRCLQSGDLVVLDFGGILDGYCVDLTRTVSVGAPGAEAGRVYDAVLAAQEAAILATQPGARVSDVDQAAREVLNGRGLGHAFVHATGHGLGLEIHEEPRVGPAKAGVPGVAPAGRDEILRPGIVITIEPGAYLPDWGGVRIEDDILVTDQGCEVLTRASRALSVV